MSETMEKMATLDLQLNLLEEIWICWTFLDGKSVSDEQIHEGTTVESEQEVDEERTTLWVKPSTFDGKSTWRTYLKQLRAADKANQW